MNEDNNYNRELLKITTENIEILPFERNIFFEISYSLINTNNDHKI